MKIGTSVRLGAALFPIVAALTLWSPSASAITFTYEGFVDFTKPGGPGGTFVNGDFDGLADVLSSNEITLSLPAGSIQEIGKHNLPGDDPIAEPAKWDDGLFGSDALESFDCDDADDPCHEFSFAFDPTAESLATGVALSDWTLVKIAIKVGGTGGEGDLDGHGIWTVADGAIDGSTISFTDFALFEADLIAAGVNGRGNSHVHFYGVATPGSVPEPGTVALFGMGLIGLGMLRRKCKTAV